MDQIATISRHPYFAELPAPILRAVASRVAVRIYERSALVYLEGEPSHGLYLVASGAARVFKAAADGKEQDLHHIGPGQSFSDAAAFDGRPTIANAQAMEPSVVFLIRREALLDLIREYPEIGVAVIRVLAARLREVSDIAVGPRASTAYRPRGEGAGMVGRIVVGRPRGPGTLPFDYFVARAGMRDWRSVPPAAQQGFPAVDNIMRQKIVRRQRRVAGRW